MIYYRVKTYTWDDVYNLERYDITGGSLPTATLGYTYDGLNRNEVFNLDAAGNLSAYTMSGVDAAMNRYTTVSGDTWYYSPWGGLQSVSQTKTYTYDTQNRLKEYTEIALGTMATPGLTPEATADWPLTIGAWAWVDDYLKETVSETACILRTLSATAPGYLTVKYLSTHDPANPDGNDPSGDFRATDYLPKYYAQILLAVDMSTAGDDYYKYLALRITPDQLALIEYDGTTVTDLDVIDSECAQNVWYPMRATFDDDVVAVTCTSDVSGTPVATLRSASTVLDNLNGNINTVGFTVGKKADYHFKELGYVESTAITGTYVEWDYDPYGRKIARTEFDGTDTKITRYVYDGWQLVQEVDIDPITEVNTVVAEYVYGPGYIDDVVQSKRDGNTYYHHTDQQYSTVAVTDVNGNVVERYNYDAFGNPTIYDGGGTPLTTGSTIGNSVLYTGRTWQPELGLYDYRNRQYDPTTGRFTTPDPLGAHGDWNNLGNAYTYVGNNPGRYLDPLGLEGIEYDLMSKPIPGSNARVYAKIFSNPENALVKVVETVVRGGVAFYDGLLPGTDFTDSYDPNLGANIAIKFLGEELSPVNLAFAGSINHVAGALFSKGNFIMNRVFRSTEGLWVDKLGNPLTGTLKHEGKTLNLVEGLIDNAARMSKKESDNMIELYCRGSILNSNDKFHKHHWWPIELGGKRKGGLTIQVQSAAPNRHTAMRGIHPEMRTFLQSEFRVNTWKDAKKKWFMLSFDEQHNLLNSFYDEYGMSMPKMKFPGIPE